MKISLNTILIVVSALVVSAGAYWYFFANSETQLPVTEVTTTNEDLVQFEALLGQLKPIKFDTSIFSDSRFNALRDLNTPISEEPIGRNDPFAPIVGAGSR